MSAPERRVVPIIAAPAAAVAAQGGWLYEKSATIHPRTVSGWFTNWRWGFVWLTQIVFYGMPWLRWNGRQAVLFDVAARRFYIFDLVLYPQDFIYLAGLLILSAYGLFLFTAVAGRLWCGFACPQTVYTEIFLWVERRIEGDRLARTRMDAAPWSMRKVLRRGGKHAAWLAIGIYTGFTFVGYFTPIHTLWAEAFTIDFGPWEWFWVLFYGFATYGNAGWMREQVCKYMCPYARFQSAMFDRDTLIISYDAHRGEPRGSRPRGADPASAGLGDCIDCTLCVQVCPTGIDIRKGLQYECIGCAACIDVCNDVMGKMSYPSGLIRYATQSGLQARWSAAQTLRRVLRPRVLVYGAILLLLSATFVTSLAWRSPFRVDVVRDRGALARVVGDGLVENVYRLQVMNATERVQHYRISVQGLNGATVATRDDVEVGPAQARWLPVSVQLPHAPGRALAAGAHPMSFRIERLAEADQASAAVSEKSTFVIPR